MTDSTQEKPRKRPNHDEHIAALKAKIAALEGKKNERVRTRLGRIKHDLDALAQPNSSPASPHVTQAIQALDRAVAAIPK